MFKSLFRRGAEASLFPSSLRMAAARAFLRRCPPSWLHAVPYRVLLEGGVPDRSSYGYCMLEAAALAKNLGYSKISAIEFGVGGGSGLLAAEKHAREITTEVGVEFQLYGFDTGEGLPAPLDYRDMPFKWQEGYYSMDQEKLRKRLQLSQLVIGNVAETCRDFLARQDPPPIGAIFWDLDFYSSTMDAFQILAGDSKYFLPRVWMYFDDLMGQAHSEFTGEAMAISDFNHRSLHAKISRNFSIRYFDSLQRWKHCIYLYHIFDHPQYSKFVGNPAERELPI